MKQVLISFSGSPGLWCPEGGERLKISGWQTSLVSYPESHGIGTVGFPGAGTAGSPGAGTAGSPGAGTAGSPGAGTAGSPGAGTVLGWSGGPMPAPLSLS